MAVAEPRTSGLSSRVAVPPTIRMQNIKRDHLHKSEGSSTLGPRSMSILLPDYAHCLLIARMQTAGKGKTVKAQAQRWEGMAAPGVFQPFLGRAVSIWRLWEVFTDTNELHVQFFLHGTLADILPVYIYTDARLRQVSLAPRPTRTGSRAKCQETVRPPASANHSITTHSRAHSHSQTWSFSGCGRAFRW